MMKLAFQSDHNLLVDCENEKTEDRDPHKPTPDVAKLKAPMIFRRNLHHWKKRLITLQDETVITFVNSNKP